MSNILTSGSLFPLRVSRTCPSPIFKQPVASVGCALTALVEHASRKALNNGESVSCRHLSACNALPLLSRVLFFNRLKLHLREMVPASLLLLTRLVYLPSRIVSSEERNLIKVVGGLPGMLFCTHPSMMFS